MYRDLLKTRPKNVSVWVVGKYTETKPTVAVCLHNIKAASLNSIYGIRDLGTELSPITMLVMMESIQNGIVENGKRGKATWLYMDCLQKNTTKVRNIKSYLLTILFNAGSTMDSYYRAMVNYDMPQFAE